MAVLSNRTDGKALQKRGPGRPKGSSRPRDPERDRLILQFPPYSGLIGKCGLRSGQGWRDYMRRVGLWETYGAGRRRKLERERVRKDSEAKAKRQISHEILESITIRAYREASDAEKKTYELFWRHPQIRYSLEQVERLYTEYFRASEAGEKVPYQKLSERSELPLISIYRLIKFVDLKPLVSYHVRPTDLQKEAIKRSIFTSLSVADTAYFLDLRVSAIESNIQRMRGSYFCDLMFRQKRSGGISLPSGLTYRLASRVYSIDDQESGLSLEEVAGYLGTFPKKVANAREHRQKIESELIYNLRLLFLDGKINKPYIRKE